MQESYKTQIVGTCGYHFALKGYRNFQRIKMVKLKSVASYCLWLVLDVIIWYVDTCVHCYSMYTGYDLCD